MLIRNIQNAIIIILLLSSIYAQEPQFFCAKEQIIHLLELKGDESVLDTDAISLESLQEQENYDAVASCHSFQWMSDPENYLEKMVNQLKPGGKCLIIAFPEESQFLQLLKTALKDPRIDSEITNGIPEDAFFIQNYQKCIMKMKCDLLHFEVVRQMIVYNNLEELRDDAKNLANHLLPEYLHSAFIEIFSEHAARYTRESGMTLIPSRALIILFSKSIDYVD